MDETRAGKFDLQWWAEYYTRWEREPPAVDLATRPTIDLRVADIGDPQP
jgi:hypothetical protein